MWISERQLIREHGAKGQIPDGVVLVGGQRIAIEVELTPKAKARTSTIIDGLCASYASVLYFAPPEVRHNLTQLATSGRWPSLGMRALPGEPGAQS